MNTTEMGENCDGFLRKKISEICVGLVTPPLDVDEKFYALPVHINIVNGFLIIVYPKTNLAFVETQLAVSRIL